MRRVAAILHEQFRGVARIFPEERTVFQILPPPTYKSQIFFQVTCLRARLCFKPSVFTVYELTSKSENILSPFLVRLHVHSHREWFLIAM